MQKNALIVFVKNPELGKVKTRLAADIGDEKALLVYHKLLNCTAHVVSDVAADKLIFYAEKIDTKDQFAENGFQQFVQKGNDLGERMLHAFEQAFDLDYKNVIIIGSDCPELTNELLEKAFQKLNEKDIVIGPALDGGYYLLGMNELHPSLFQNKTWSHSNVFEEALEEIEQLNLKYSELEKLSDLDRAEDLAYLNDKGNFQFNV